tara:strand:- start:68181 stop:68738 length:558 start_codon:yes stop_codon:yes gene_type:complete
MQETLEQIFRIACRELPHKHHSFGDEEAVMYKGFKISKKDHTYFWEDTRYDGYYEPVDPLITERVLSNGFSKTLTQVMSHKDKDKLLKITREIEKIDKQKNHWIKKSTQNWNKYKIQKDLISKNTDLSNKDILEKTGSIELRYEKYKNLYKKKRRILKVEKEELMVNYHFYESRIILYNNNKKQI